MFYQRREFLKTGAVLGTVTTLGAPQPPRWGQGHSVHILSTYVAGTGYHAACHPGDIFKSLGPGAQVHIRREPYHPYDSQSIAVLTASDEMLGYLPGADGKAVAGLIDAGYIPTAKVRSVTDMRPHPDIRLDIGVLL